MATIRPVECEGERFNAHRHYCAILFNIFFDDEVFLKGAPLRNFVNFFFFVKRFFFIISPCCVAHAPSTVFSPPLCYFSTGGKTGATTSARCQPPAKTGRFESFEKLLDASKFCFVWIILQNTHFFNPVSINVLHSGCETNDSYEYS